jgi:hypothetical protein
MFTFSVDHELPVVLPSTADEANEVAERYQEDVHWVAMEGWRKAKKNRRERAAVQGLADHKEKDVAHLAVKLHRKWASLLKGERSVNAPNVNAPGVSRHLTGRSATDNGFADCMQF